MAELQTLTWAAIGALPNISMKPEHFGGDYLAMVGPFDPRYRDAVANSVNLDQFLGRFEGTHGQKLLPSLLVRSDAYPDRPTSEALASFRDIVVAAVVLDVRVRTITWGRNVGPLYSDAFDVYPWMISKDGARLLAQNSSMWAIHKLETFRGSASPIVPVQDVNDEPGNAMLFAQLHSLWKARYINGDEDWKGRAILRSLNMLTSALRLSSATGSTESFFDFGRMLSIWVSAFEILVHPGTAAGVNLRKVLELVSTVPWQSAILREQVHRVVFGGGKVAHVNLADILYRKFYSLRNDFLHGNPVAPKDFLLENGTSVLDYTAALFRMALSAVLPSGEVSAEDVVYGQRSREEFAASFWENGFRRDCEECLRMAIEPRHESEEEIEA